MKKILLPIIICLAISGAQGQSQEVINTQVQALKTGVLLVQLRNHEAYRDSILAFGGEKTAQRSLLFEKVVNEILLKQFSEDFKFCPVYFFYSDKTDSIQNKNFNFLLGKNLGKLNLDSIEMNRFSHLFYAGVRHVVYDTEFNTTFAENIVMMDQDFRQLSSSFPIIIDSRVSRLYKMFFSTPAKKRKKKQDLILKKYKKSIAELWDSQLTNHYNRVIK